MYNSTIFKERRGGPLIGYRVLLRILRYFRFTTAIRAGLKFAGNEKITIGGGEALWLFVNKVKIVDFVANENVTSACFYIDLSPAATSGGGTITPQQGTLSSGSCTGLAPAGNTATLELTVSL